MLPLQPAPVESAHAESGGAQPAHTRGKKGGRQSETGTLTVGWFGDRKRIPPGTGIRVTRFHVWQDLSSSGDDKMAPLHATVALEMSNEWYSNLTTSDGIIRIELPDYAESIEARLVLHNVHHELDAAELGSNRRLQFVVSPTPLHRQLNAGDTARGIAKLKFGNRKVTLKLLETVVETTRRDPLSP